MNGLRLQTNGEVQRSSHLLSPTSTPEPDEAALVLKRRVLSLNQEECLQNVANIAQCDLPGQAASSHDEAILSDTSEKIRLIKRPGDGSRRSSVSEHELNLKLSSRQTPDLTIEASTVPLRAATPILESALEEEVGDEATDGQDSHKISGVMLERPLEVNAIKSGERIRKNSRIKDAHHDKEAATVKTPGTELKHGRPALNSRSITTPSYIRRRNSRSRSRTYTGAQDGEERISSRQLLSHAQDHKDEHLKSLHHDRYKEVRDTKEPTFRPPNILPLPPLSMPTFLSLELSATNPPPAYIYRPAATDSPYESSKVKYARLLNFLKIPLKIEGILGFGALACMDAWMHVLTILPLRFVLAVAILVRWWASVIVKECRDLWGFVYGGIPRLWQRARFNEGQTPLSTPVDEVPPTISRKSSSSLVPGISPANRQLDQVPSTFKSQDFKEPKPRRLRNSRFRHRHTKFMPSTLEPSHKADILKGLLVIASCSMLMRFDASRMYHGIRGQSAIKLYVIYNVLEVCDRLLSAVGQDVLECLFSRETLDRNPNGRSKVLRPLGMFGLALIYTVAHATALFYQVITLNVAVNSYSNALLTLLMSNQFVEIKGTVFKRFEKENLFQITCADIVERFQLWLMLFIIAMRNVVEVGGLSIQSSKTSWTVMFTGTGNITASTTFAATSIIPVSFTIFPKYIAQVLNPFLLVLGSEMFVDWLKHAYITKFNQYKPDVYGKFFDVLAKDYYANAFRDANLTKRLGLPVIPLSCLFIRAAIQTYHMFIAMHMPPPLPGSASITSDTISSPVTTAALDHIDHVFRRALGRSSFGAGATSQPWYHLSSWSFDDVIAGCTMLIVFFIIYIMFLAFKLLLGMLLLSIARRRYYKMHEREMMGVATGGKYIGGWGIVDVDEEKRRHIYNDDSDALKRLRERDDKGKKEEEQEREGGTSFGHVSRYAMVAKRIW